MSLPRIHYFLETNIEVWFITAMNPNRPSGCDFLNSLLCPDGHDNGLTFLTQNRLPVNQVHYILSGEERIDIKISPSYHFVCYRELKGHFPKNFTDLLVSCYKCKKWWTYCQSSRSSWQKSGYSIWYIYNH